MGLDTILTEIRNNIVGAGMGAVIGVVLGYTAGKAPQIIRRALSVMSSGYSNRESTRMRKFANRALNSPNFYKFLSWYHSVTLYQHENTIYPAVVFPISDPFSTGHIFPTIW